MINYIVAFSGPVGRALQSLKNDKKGVTALEYGILAGMVATVITVAAANYGVAVGNFFTTLSATITALPH